MISFLTSFVSACQIIFFLFLAFWILRVYGVYLMRMAYLFTESHFSYLDAETYEKQLEFLKGSISNERMFSDLTEEELDRTKRFATFLFKHLGGKGRYAKSMTWMLLANSILVTIAAFFSFGWFLIALEATTTASLSALFVFVVLFHIWNTWMKAKDFWRTNLS